VVIETFTSHLYTSTFMKRMRLLILVASLIAGDALADTCTGWAGVRAPVHYASSADRIALVRDLDGDGKPEIIVSGNHADAIGALSLFSNRGDGTFAAERLLVRGFGEELQDIADLNHDGIPDLLTSDYWSNGIVVYLGKGALDFDGGARYETATHGGPSLIIDYDHDGTPDVISLSFGSGNPVRVHLFHGLGDGTLGSKTTFDTQLANGEWPSARAINGALEILVSERSGYLGILHFANGGITLSRVVAGPGFDLSSTFADVNGDGIADIVDTDLFESPSESIFVTLANADGSFRARTQLPHPRKTIFPVQVRVKDLDADGRADLVVSDFQSPTLHLYRGNGAGDFAEGIAIDAGAPVNAFDIADVNGDGYLDIVTTNNDHTVSVLINRGPCPPSRRHAAKH
jgi:VCBS repeat protein